MCHANCVRSCDEGSHIYGGYEFKAHEQQRMRYECHPFVLAAQELDRVPTTTAISIRTKRMAKRFRLYVLSLDCYRMRCIWMECFSKTLTHSNDDETNMPPPLQAAEDPEAGLQCWVDPS